MTMALLCGNLRDLFIHKNDVSNMCCNSYNYMYHSVSCSTGVLTQLK